MTSPTIATCDPSEKCGHVFVLQCDSVGLAADALLVPNAAIKQRLRDACIRDGKTHIFKAACINDGDNIQLAVALVKG